MSALQFEPFKKIGRIKQSCVITEKIDGTNAQIQFDAEGGMMVGSRKREIWPEGAGRPPGCDNFGFAQWAYANQAALFDFLGEGRHYGEWAGSGIQRGYGLVSKRFFLFNARRFGHNKQPVPPALRAIGLDVVPVLYEGPYSDGSLEETMYQLKARGSRVGIDFRNPEGVIVYHCGLKTYFKETFDYNQGKWGNK